MMNISDEPVTKLHALFKAEVDGLAADLEVPARAYFGGSLNLLDDTEIVDLSLELQYLMGGLLASDDPTSLSSPAYQALESFIVNLARKVLSRGGDVEGLVRYTQALQRALILKLEERNAVPFTRSRSVLAFFSDIFLELIFTVYRTYLDQKEQTIRSQESELRETATPITEIWEGVITLPIIGSLDSSRTVLIMESLLHRIAEEHSKVVVMDLTGVSAMDSQVSHHLIQMVRAIKLMGAQAILTGIRPEIARAFTQLEIDLGDINTRGNLADGLKDAFRLIGVKVVRVSDRDGDA
jgi:rsbT co-antagonist protein RsbR